MSEQLLNDLNMLTSSPSEVPAKTSAPLAIEVAWTVLRVLCSGTASRSSSAPDPAGSSSKMSLRARVFGSTASVGPWNGSIMKRYRSRLRRAISGLRTDAGESSLLPTLTETGNLLAPSMQKWPAHRLLPTLRASDGTKSGNQPRTGPPCDPGLRQVAGAALNPTWCEWFMGAPIGWTEPVREWRRSATRASRSAPKSSGT